MIKQFLLLSAVAMISFTSCKKTKTIQEELPKGTVTLSGNFVSSVHPTSGTAKVVDSIGKKYLVFENFKTDNGPALEVWLSKNTSVADYKNLGALKAANGNFYYELTTDQNTAVYNHVLIWCERFSVLFGYAKVQ